VHILTFDIEDWFHTFDKGYHKRMDKWSSLPSGLERNVDMICRFLNERGIKATFFWLGREATKHPHLIREISDLEHEIGLHSYYHIRLNELDRKSFRENTYKAKNILEEITGQKITVYRAPGMSITEKTLWAFEVLAKLGIDHDSSLVTNQLIGNKRIPNNPLLIDYHDFLIREFPITSIPFFGKPFNYAGSGFFRITPYWYLHNKITNAKYTMSYFHPRDFDVDIHKAIHNNPFLKFKYRLGAKNARSKLSRLSENVNWKTIKDITKQYDWEDASRIKLL